jgi:hypothetical protein
VQEHSDDDGDGGETRSRRKTNEFYSRNDAIANRPINYIDVEIRSIPAIVLFVVVCCLIVFAAATLSST